MMVRRVCNIARVIVIFGLVSLATIESHPSKRKARRSSRRRLFRFVSRWNFFSSRFVRRSRISCVRSIHRHSSIPCSIVMQIWILLLCRCDLRYLFGKRSLTLRHVQRTRIFRSSLIRFFQVWIKCRKFFQNISIPETTPYFLCNRKS